MMKVQEIIRCIEEWAPPALQESYDNSGLILGNPNDKVNGVMLCLDVTEEVVEEAKSKKCNLIVSHHPLIFQPIKRLNGKTQKERTILKLIRSEIALYAAHTSLDNAEKGINHALAGLLGVSRLKTLIPKAGLLKKLVTFCPIDHTEKVRKALFDAGAGNIGNYDSCSFNLQGTGSFRANDYATPFVGKRNQLHLEPETRIETIFPSYLQSRILEALLASHPYEEVAYDIYSLDNDYENVGSGVVGLLNKPSEPKAFLLKVKKALGIKTLNYSHFTKKSISRVAICSGSGSFAIMPALAAGADALITADVRYHDYQIPEGKLLLIDAGHYETEVIVKEILFNRLCEKFPNFAVFMAKKDINPINRL